MSPLSDFRRSIVALALIFCSGGSFLFAQERSATATSDQTKELLERAIAQAESTAAISHQLKDVFQRAAKGVVKIHGVDEHRAVVTMFHIQGMPHAEISKILRVSEGTVRSRLFYANRQLQNYLDEFRRNPVS